MAHGAILSLFSLLICAEALAAVIQTQQTVLAAVGEDAEFSCQLLETKDVLQVTWQKISADNGENVATYNKYFGQRVNAGFKDKFKFGITELQNCSIVIRNVMEQDESCYRCLFNTYPEGSFTGRTCLQVYELHEPVLDVTESNSPAEWLVSCSATGRPAPTVTLSVSQRDLSFSHYDTVSVSNSNATFTVTTTAVLSGSRGSSTQVGCAARVLSAPHREVTDIIPEVKVVSAASADDDDSTWILVAAVVTLMLFAAAALITVLLKGRDRKRDPEKNKTPKKSTGDIDGNKTFFIEKENDGIRPRTPNNSPSKDRLKASPPTRRRHEL